MGKNIANKPPTVVLNAKLISAKPSDDYLKIKPSEDKPIGLKPYILVEDHFGADPKKATIPTLNTPLQLGKALGSDTLAKNLSAQQESRKGLTAQLSMVEKQAKKLSSKLEELKANHEILETEQSQVKAPARSIADINLQIKQDMHRKNINGALSQVDTHAGMQGKQGTQAFHDKVSAEITSLPGTPTVSAEEIKLYITDLAGLKVFPDNKLQRDKFFEYQERESSFYQGVLRDLEGHAQISKAKQNKELKLQKSQAAYDKVTTEEKTLSATQIQLKQEINLTQRVESVLTAKQAAVKKSKVVAEMDLNIARIELLQSKGDKKLSNLNALVKGQKIPLTLSGRQTELKKLQATNAQLEKDALFADTIFDQHINRIALAETGSDPKAIPKQTWTSWFSDTALDWTPGALQSALGIDYQESRSVGFETRQTLIFEKLRADSGITSTKEAYGALAERLKTKDGALQLMRELPGIVKDSPHILKDMAGDLSHAMSILTASNSDPRLKTIADNILTRTKVENLMEDFLVGNATVESKRIPKEWFALMHLTSLAPYAAREFKELGNETASGQLASYIPFLGPTLKPLANTAQRLAQTHLEKKVSKSIPASTSDAVTALTAVYKGEQSIHMAAAAYGAKQVLRSATRTVSGQVRNHMEKSWKDVLVGHPKSYLAWWKETEGKIGERAVRLGTEFGAPAIAATVVAVTLNPFIGIPLALGVFYGGHRSAKKLNKDGIFTKTTHALNAKKQRDAIKNSLMTDEGYQDFVHEYTQKLGGTHKELDAIHEGLYEETARMILGANIKVQKSLEAEGTYQKLTPEMFTSRMEQVLARGIKDSQSSKAEFLAKRKGKESLKPWTMNGDVSKELIETYEDALFSRVGKVNQRYQRQISNA